MEWNKLEVYQPSQRFGLLIFQKPQWSI